MGCGGGGGGGGGGWRLRIPKLELPRSSCTRFSAGYRSCMHFSLVTVLRCAGVKIDQSHTTS